VIDRRGLERVRQLVVKELRQVFRDDRMRRVVFVAPVMQLLIFGYAVSTDVKDTALFVVDHDRSAESRAVVEALTAGGYFRVVGRSDRAGALVEVLDRGEATVGLHIPPGYARDLRHPHGAKLQLIVDGTNSNVATVALGYAEQILRTHALGEMAVDFRPPVDLRERAWFNADLKSRNYNVPAVIGAVMLIITLILTALAVVRERELGTLEQLMVSPLTPGELIAGKTIPFALIALFDLVLITTIALLWFHIPFRGAPPLLLLAAVLFLLSGLGLGLLISTISNTQQEAFLVTFMVMMPMMILSGFMFPVTSMPESFQWLTLLNPLRHYLEIARAIFLKGATFAELWRPYAFLFVMGTAVLGFAATRFHKTVR
jgi:ABC-2 type transport system permease protein